MMYPGWKSLASAASARCAGANAVRPPSVTSATETIASSARSFEKRDRMAVSVNSRPPNLQPVAEPYPLARIADG